MADQRPCKLSFESSPLAVSTHHSCVVWASRKGRDIGPPAPSRAPSDNAHRQTSFLATSCLETICQTKTRCTPPSPPSSRAAWFLSCVVSPSSRVTTSDQRILCGDDRVFSSGRDNFGSFEAERRFGGLSRDNPRELVRSVLPADTCAQQTGGRPSRVLFGLGYCEEMGEIPRAAKRIRRFGLLN